MTRRIHSELSVANSRGCDNLSRRLGLVLLAALAATGLLVLPGCGGGTTSSGDEGSLRLLNATAEFASLELVDGSDSVASAVANYTVSGYSELDDGNYTLALRSAGNGVNLVSVSASVAEDSHATLVAYTSGGTPAVVSLEEDAERPAAGNGRLRVLNTASVEAGPVDIYVLPAATPCTAIPAATPPAAASLSLAGSLAAIDLGTASGGSTYNVCAVAAGDKADLRLDFAGVAFADRGAATLVLVKTPSGVLLDGLLLNQQGALAVRRNASARLRVVASLPAAGAVTISATPAAGGSPFLLADALVSPAVGSYRLVTAGSLNLVVNGNPVPATVGAGTDVTLLVSAATAAGVSPIVDDNTPSTSSSRPTRLRLFNGAGGGAALTVDSTPVADSVASGSASPPVSLAASTGTAVIAATSNGVALPTLTGQTLAAGRVYSLFVLNGSAAGSRLLSLRADR